VLRELGLDGRTLVVVTSDHGEEMAEHVPTNIGDHGHSLYDDLLHVPLVVYDPRGPYAVKRVRAQVRTLDVLPTIAELLGVALPSTLDGASLVPMLRGTDPAGRPVVSGWNRKGRLRASLRDGGFKYIATIGDASVKFPLLQPPPDHELFDLGSDPGETTNLYAAQPKRAQAMHDALMKRREQIQQRGGMPVEAVDHELDERLKSLGYVR